MTNEEAIKEIKEMVAYWEEEYPMATDEITAMKMAIEALENNDKLAEDLQNCLEMYKKKKAEVKALKQNQWIPCSECRYCDNEMFCHAFKGLGRRVKADEYCSTAERKGEQE